MTTDNLRHVSLAINMFLAGASYTLTFMAEQPPLFWLVLALGATGAGGADLINLHKRLNQERAHGP